MMNKSNLKVIGKHSSENSKRRSALQLAVLLAAASFACAPAASFAADDGSSGSLMDYTTVDASSIGPGEIWLHDGRGLLVMDGDATTELVRIRAEQNPGEIIIENGMLFLNNFAGRWDDVVGLAVENDAKAVITGNGVLRIVSGAQARNSDYAQYQSAIWVGSEDISYNTCLTVEGVSLELVADKGIRVDKGSTFYLDNTKSENGHVYIGGYYDENGEFGNFATINSRGILTTEGTSSVEIHTKDLKIYSIGADREPSTLITTSQLGRLDESVREALGEKPAKITIAADTMDFEAYGDIDQTDIVIYSYGSSGYFSSEIALSGSSLNIRTDWEAALWAQGSDTGSGHYALLTADFTGGDITIKSEHDAVLAFYDATVDMKADTVAISGYISSETTGTDSNGNTVAIPSAAIAARNGGTVLIQAAKSFDLEGTADAFMANLASIVTVEAGTIAVHGITGTKYAAVSSYSGSTVTLAAEDALTVDTKNVYLAYASGGNIVLKGKTVNLTGDKELLYAKSGGVITVDAGDVNISGASSPSYSAVTANGSTISVTASGAVTIDAPEDAVMAFSGSSVDIGADSISIDKVNSASYAAVSSWSSSSVNLTAENTLSITSESSDLVYATNGTVTISAGNLVLTRAEDNDAVYVKKNGAVALNADSENGTFLEGKTTKLSGDLYATGQGVIEVGLGTKDSVFTGGAWDGYFNASSTYGIICIYAGNGATWNVRQYGGGYTTTVAAFDSQGSSVVDLTGETVAQDLNIGYLTGSGAEFRLRTQVDENTTGEWRDHVNIRVGSGAHSILVTAVGNKDPGVPDWTEDVQADYLIRHYENYGATSVRLDTAASDADSSESGVAAQSDGADPLSFVLANKNQAVDVGNRRYTLMTRDFTYNGTSVGTEWYLQYSGAVPEDPTDNTEPGTDPEDNPGDDPKKDDPGDTPSGNPEDATPQNPDDSTFIAEKPVLDQEFEHLSSSAQLVTTLAGYGSMYSAWTANLTDLRKRLGEVRYGAQDGLWARAIWQKDTTDGLTGGKFEQKLKGIQVGLDRIVTQNEDRMWLVGANFKYADGDQKVKGMDYGRGDMTTYGAFLYATYANYKGYYTDLVLSLDHYKEKLAAEQTDYTVTHGRYNTWGWGASVETGKMFSSTQSDEGWGPWYANWWVEPQLQLAYYWGKGKNFTMDNGMTVEQKNGQSLIGRAGVVIGKKFNYGRNRKTVDKRYSQFYVKAGVKNEFLGDEKMTVNGERFSNNLKGARVYYGAGFDWNVSDQLRLYAQVEREQGSKYKRDYEVSVGLRWQF
jgi:outer membrane autotransporter protein